MYYLQDSRSLSGSGPALAHDNDVAGEVAVLSRMDAMMASIEKVVAGDQAAAPNESLEISTKIVGDVRSELQTLANRAVASFRSVDWREDVPTELPHFADVGLPAMFQQITSFLERCASSFAIKDAQILQLGRAAEENACASKASYPSDHPSEAKGSSWCASSVDLGSGVAHPQTASSPTPAPYATASANANAGTALVTDPTRPDPTSTAATEAAAAPPVANPGLTPAPSQPPPLVASSLPPSAAPPGAQGGAGVGAGAVASIPPPQAPAAAVRHDDTQLLAHGGLRMHQKPMRAVGELGGGSPELQCLDTPSSVSTTTLSAHTVTASNSPYHTEARAYIDLGSGVAHPQTASSPTPAPYATASANANAGTALVTDPTRPDPTSTAATEAAAAPPVANPGLTPAPSQPPPLVASSLPPSAAPPGAQGGAGVGAGAVASIPPPQAPAAAVRHDDTQLRAHGGLRMHQKPMRAVGEPAPAQVEAASPTGVLGDLAVPDGTSMRHGQLPALRDPTETDAHLLGEHLLGDLGSLGRGATPTQDELTHLRRVVAMMTPGLHSQRLPWSPKLEASSDPAVVHAVRVAQSSSKHKAAEDGGSLSRMQQAAGVSSDRWAKRRAHLEFERKRSAEAAMQAFAAVHYNGGVFVEMHSRFDEPRPPTSDGVDPALPPIRSTPGSVTRALVANQPSPGHSARRVQRGGLQPSSSAPSISSRGPQLQRVGPAGRPHGLIPSQPGRLLAGTAGQ